MRIKLDCNWTSTEEITKRLLKQFKTTEEDTRSIEFCADSNYDVCVGFNFLGETTVSAKPTLMFPQEPSWVGSHQKTFENYSKVKVFGFDRDNYFPKEVVEETVAHMFYGGTGPWDEGYDNWSYHNLTKSNFPKEKKICSFISSRGINETIFPPTCLYPQRISLVQNIHQHTKFIDFFGGWGNQENLKSSVQRKFDTLKHYKFCLTVENSNEKNYISEKFYDCILTNTIPIYYGCTNIKEYWPENGYFLIDDISDHSNIIKLLNWIDKNEDKIYRQMLPNVVKMKNRYFSEFNLLKKINNELNKI